MEETFQSQQNPVYVPSPSQSPKRSRFLPVAIFIVIVIVLIFAGTRLLSSKNSKQSNTQISVTPTPTPYQFPTDTPTPSQKETTPTPTARPTVNPVDSATGLDRSTLTVFVQNGSGEFGAASKASDALKGFGYHITSIGNANNFDYENVTIQVKSTKSNFLSLLKKDLGFSYTVGSASADLSSDSSEDALVIIGK